MRRWKGFQLCAVDGTTALLPNRPAIMTEFGKHLNQAGPFALAQVMAAAARSVMMYSTDCV